MKKLLILFMAANFAIASFASASTGDDEKIALAIRNHDFEMMSSIISSGVKIKSKFLTHVGTNYPMYDLIFPALTDIQIEDLNQTLRILTAHAYWDFDKSIPVAKKLLDLGADPNSKDKYGQTAIYLGHFWCGNESNPWQDCDLVNFIEGYKL